MKIVASRLVALLAAVALLAGGINHAAAQGAPDPIGFSIAGVSQTEGDSGQSTFHFEVSLSRADSAPNTVQYYTTNGTATAGDDYTGFAQGTPQTITFPAGMTTESIDIQVNGDTAYEPDENFTVTLANPSGDGVITTPSATGTIENDDLAPVSFSTVGVSQAEGDSGQSTFHFEVSLSRPDSVPNTAEYYTTNGTATAGDDYTGFAQGTPQTITFPAGMTTESIDIQVSGDTTYEPDETFTVTLVNPSGDGVITTPSATGTIENDDPKPAPATISVNTTAMSIDAGTCTDASNDIVIADLPGSDGNISLPEAICAANGTAGADTIVLADTTYTLTTPHNYWYGPTGLPPVYSDITIEGHGAIIERDPAATNFRLFYVAGELHKVIIGASPSRGSLTLRDLALKNGLAKGGSADGGGGGAGLGGAIYNQGTLVLERVTATANLAEGGDSGVAGLGYGGGGLGGDGKGDGGGGFRGDSNGSNGGDFLGGEGGSGTSGGASAIGGDGADAPGGGLTCGGGGGGFAADATGCTAADGGGDGGDGGSGNRGGGGGFGGGGGDDLSGGGVGGGGGLVNGNGSGGAGGSGGFGGGGGGGIFADGGSGGFGGGGGAGGSSGGVGGFGGGGGANDGGGGGGMGGVIFNHFGRVTVRNSTLAGNSARGGDTSSGGGGSAYGGAIFNLNGTVTVQSSTLAGNTVDPGIFTGRVGAPGQAAGGAIYQRFQATAVGNTVAAVATTATATTMTIENTILGNTTGGNDCALSSSGAATAVSLVGNNLIENNACGGAPLTADPALSALADNGGLTRTMLPAVGSPVIDGGACASPTADQRGTSRPQGSACDLGATELQQVQISVDVSTPNGSVSVAATPVPASGDIAGCAQSVGACAAYYVIEPAAPAVALNLAPNAGYHVASVSGCGGSLAGTTWTTAALSADCTVNVTFGINSHTVSGAVASGQGTIAPLSQSVADGATATATVTPDTGWHIGSVTGCGGSLASNVYTTGPISADCTVSATFVINQYTLIYSAGANGSISGSTPQTVNHGASGTAVTAVPDTGYEFLQWSDGLTANPRTDSNVTADINVEASFAAAIFTVTATVSASGHGSVSPPTRTVAYGDTARFTVTPEPGYQIDNVTSTCGGTLSGNIFATGPVTGPCAITAAFALIPPAAPVPAVDWRGLLALLTLLAGMAALGLRRREAGWRTGKPF